VHTVQAENAEKIWGWLHERGGIAVWTSVNLSNPGAGWTTPARREDGSPTGKPSWQAGDTPQIITDPADVLVSVDKEVGRFRVAVRMASQGLMTKVSDGGARRIRRAVAKAGEGAYHVFDYSTQQAVIMAPEKTMPLTEWHERETQGSDVHA
jgi:ribosomal protein S6